MPRGGFAATKPPAKWGLGFEMRNSKAWRYFATILQLRNGCTVLQNGTRVLRGGFAAAKIFAKGDRTLGKHFAAGGDFRRGPF